MFHGIQRNLAGKRVLRSGLILLAITLSFLAVPAAAVIGCNLAPNPAFESLSAGMPASWGLAVYSGSATASLSTYPSPVQSGKYAVKVVVTTPGDIEWRTIPEKTAIAVLGGTSYTVSARLKVGATSQQADLRVIEWTQAGVFVADHFFPLSAPTVDWQTLESSFTTAGATRYVSIRLMHHVSPNATFIWDDVRFWKNIPNERCFDARHYITQTTPGERWCFLPPVGVAVCADGAKNADGEFVRDSTHGTRNIFSHTGDGITEPLGIGVVKWLDATNNGRWSCFSNDGEPCPDDGNSPNAQYPAVNAPLMASLPVLNVVPTPSSRTPNAAPLNGWQGFDVWGLNPVTGLQFGSAIGLTIWHRAWGFILPSFYLGPTLGTRANIAVIEYDAIGMDTEPIGFQGGSRLERYYYAPGIGLVRAEGSEDPDCRDLIPEPSICDGNYSDNVNGAATYYSRIPGDFRFDFNGPAWVQTDWWE